MDEQIPSHEIEHALQPASEAQAKDFSRRTLLMSIGVALNAVVGLAIATPVAAYLLGPVIKRKDYLDWVDLGSASDFPVGETTLVTYQNPFTNSWDGATAKVPAYVRKTSNTEFTVFAINCAHLGCPVRWFKESQLFLCPCHGGAYYADGSRASGPPERGLFTYALKVTNGKLLINAGQLPTLQNQAKAGPCSGAKNASPAMVASIEPASKEFAKTEDDCGCSGKSTIG